jgi:Leucine-rich repeat (LRR) protein
MGAAVSFQHGAEEASDPWWGLVGIDALTKVKSEEGFTLVLESKDEASANKVLTMAPEKEALRVVAADIELDDESLPLCFSSAAGEDKDNTVNTICSRVTTLNVSGNSLGSLSPLGALPALRGLTAGGNPLNSWDAPALLRGCCFLVELDLSYTYGLGALLASSFEEVEVAASSTSATSTTTSAAMHALPPPLPLPPPSPFAHLGPTLLSLNLASCGLTTLAFRTRGGGGGGGGGVLDGGAAADDGFAGGVAYDDDKQEEQGGVLVLGGLSCLLELTLAENELDDLNSLLSPNG